MRELQELWRQVDDCSFCKSAGNKLQHILGGGKEEKPSVMFCFINPTYRNITTDPDYEGQRFPFMGTTKVWRVFIKAGLLEPDIDNKIRQGWNQELIDEVIGKVAQKGFYFTNLVKCAQPHADNPKTKEIRTLLPLLLKEISIVKPKLICCFGGMPFRWLTNINDLKLTEHFDRQKQSDKLITYQTIPIDGKTYPVFPCYFPVGRGNPKKATELLQILKRIYLEV
ncbi:hypothetical protein KY336_02285 [Candidatus Woesearchaeota archaeon]|nr:hypothetical protein [Candidatus Woesearchaeota archaeon]